MNKLEKREAFIHLLLPLTKDKPKTIKSEREWSNELKWQETGLVESLLQTSKT